MAIQFAVLFIWIPEHDRIDRIAEIFIVLLEIKNIESLIHVFCCVINIKMNKKKEKKNYLYSIKIIN